MNQNKDKIKNKEIMARKEVLSGLKEDIKNLKKMERQLNKVDKLFDDLKALKLIK